MISQLGMPRQHARAQSRREVGSGLGRVCAQPRGLAGARSGLAVGTGLVPRGG